MHPIRSHVAVMTLISFVVMCVGVVLPDAANATVQQSFPGCPILRQGATGACVKHLQSDLDTVKPAHRLNISGVFGAPTAAAVRDFQRQYGLPVTGVVDFVTAGSLDQFAAGARSLGRSSKPEAPSTPPPSGNADQGGPVTTDFDIDKAMADALCGLTAQVMAAPAILAGPELTAAADLTAKNYDSYCVGGTKKMKADAFLNLADATTAYFKDKGLSAIFEGRIETILNRLGSESKTTLNVASNVWNMFILSLIQRLKLDEVKCEQANKFPPPLSCSTQKLTNDLLGLLRK